MGFVTQLIVLFRRPLTSAYCRAGILLSSRVPPEGVGVSPRVSVRPLRACERGEMGEDKITARDGLHLSKVYGGLLIC